jgi:hypothetical protein
MLKQVFFLMMLVGCATSKTVSNSGLLGFAGENFSSTNSPCLDGVITAIDHSCNEPAIIEEGIPYTLISCPTVRPGTNPWDKYNVFVSTNHRIEEPKYSTLICADPHARVYIQKRP